MTDKVEVFNVNTPGRSERVDAAKYNAMRAAVLSVAPHAPPGITAAELKETAMPHLPQALFPGGKTTGWWLKCVQLDLEARGLMVRTKGSPLRFHLTNKENRDEQH